MRKIKVSARSWTLYIGCYFTQIALSSTNSDMENEYLRMLQIAGYRGRFLKNFLGVSPQTPQLEDIFLPHLVSIFFISKVFKIYLSNFL